MTDQPPPAIKAHSSAWQGRTQCQAAWLEVIALSQQTLFVADQDGQNWPDDSPTLIDALEGFLRRSRLARLHILVADPSRLARDAAPRLRQLQRRHSAAVSVRQMLEAPDRKQSVLLGDAMHAVLRPQADTLRGTCLIGQAERLAPTVMAWLNLWQGSPPCLPATTLGL